MKQLFMDMLKECKEGDVYQIEYFNEKVEVVIPDEDVEIIVDCALKIMDEVEIMKEQGLLSRQIIMDRAEELRKKHEGKETMFYNVISGFASGGIYNRDIFKEIAETVGKIIGYDLDSAYWQLLGRIGVLSGILTVIEGYFINEDKEAIYERCVWIYIRSCMYMKSKMDEK